MDSCEKYQLLITSYIDNTITPEGRAGLERHISSCAACAAELRDTLATVAFLHSAPTPIPSAAFLDHISAPATYTNPSRKNVTPIATRKTRRLSVPRLALAASFLLVIGIFSLIASPRNPLGKTSSRPAADNTVIASLPDAYDSSMLLSIYTDTSAGIAVTAAGASTPSQINTSSSHLQWLGTSVQPDSDTATGILKTIENISEEEARAIISDI